MILLRCILTVFYQRHVSALVMSHLQVDYFFLVRQNIQLAMLLLSVTYQISYNIYKNLK